MERFGTRPKNRTTNDKPCKFCNAPNWSPTHKFPALDKLCNNCGKKRHFARMCRPKEIYRRKTQNVTEETTAIGGESNESESSVYRIERNKKISDRIKHLTAKVNVNGMEKDFIVDTGSPISIKPADENILKKTELQKTKHRYQDINRNEVKCRGQIPTDIEYENKKQKLQKLIIITKRDDL